MTNDDQHKAGFVNIIGKPNVGKSTLMNKMVGEKLSIITSKAQTTRHRIMGILNGDDFQIVYSDTPGILHPKYELHKAMMRFVDSSLEDADIILFLSDIFEKPEEFQTENPENKIIQKIKNLSVPVFLLLNKIDLAKEETLVTEKIKLWSNYFPPENIIPVSALEGFNLDKVFDKILANIPLHPAFFPKDELTDKTERFFASEIIREKIFLHYKQEIPYCCEVVITEFKEKEDIIVIRSEIMVERKSQKGILIGKGGESLKKIGIEARTDMEKFFEKKVFLEQFVKVDEDWRKNSRKLNRFGYSV